MAVLAQVAHDPRAALAAATGDDDAHCRPPRGKYDGGRVGPVGGQGATNGDVNRSTVVVLIPAWSRADWSDWA